MWLEKGLETMLRKSGVDDGMVGEEDETAHVVVPTSTLDAPTTSYTIAKKAPFKNVTVSRLATEFGAVDFIPALTTFLHEHIPGCNITPNAHDTYDLFKQVIISLPPNRYLSELKIRTNHIRAIPAVTGKGRKAGAPAVFDTTLVGEDIKEYRTLGGIAGMFSSIHHLYMLQLLMFCFRPSHCPSPCNLLPSRTIRFISPAPRIRRMVHIFGHP